MPSIGNLFRGIIFLVLLETPRELLYVFLKSLKSSHTPIQKFSTIIAFCIIGSFVIYGFMGIHEDFNQWRTKEWREVLLVSEYKNDIYNFFDRYNERFLAHDCDFMREVGADEAMYDKLNRIIWPKDQYTCEEFVRFQKKYIVPLKVDPIEKAGDKYRAKGEAIIIMINQGEPWKVEAIYFNLWKKIDWDLWHFDGPKNGPRKIPIEITSPV